MSRVIKFRGIDIFDKVFRYGSFIKTDVDAPAIVYGDGEQAEIKEETLGQYIGMQDVKGNDVFEDDLLICPSGDFHQIVFESYFACFNTMHLISGEVSDISIDGMNECFEIVGNIHQNPELLT